jgi:hypothetical protein
MTAEEKAVDTIIREHYARIGRKGGRAGKGSPRKKISAKAGAEARWRRQHPVPKPPEEIPA